MLNQEVCCANSALAVITFECSLVCFQVLMMHRQLFGEATANVHNVFECGESAVARFTSSLIPEPVDTNSVLCPCLQLI